MLVDRVVALRETALFVPRTVRHLTGNIRLRTAEPEGLTEAKLAAAGFMD